MFMVHVYLEQLMVMLRDGRTLIAFLRSLDQFGMFISFPNKLTDIYLRIIF
jgi:small nuclear ribonucleoprotein (snRNP)-like protein